MQLCVIVSVDEYGNYIEHINGDVLLSFPEEENSSFFPQPADGEGKPSMNDDKKNIFCTGNAFSVGVGVDVEAGPLNAGGEETICSTGFIDLFNSQIDLLS